MYQTLKPQECGCRTRACPHCGSQAFHKHGFYYRQGDARQVRRFRCQSCRKTFSRAGFSAFYRYRHRRLNERISRLLVNGGTLRGIAKQLNLDKDTVARRLPLLATSARQREQQSLDKAPLANTVQFDELITIEHSKMKPLSVAVICDADRWRILGFEVSRIPASGHLAEKSRKKYGPRPDESTAARQHLLERTAPCIADQAVVHTDKHPAYPALVKQNLPNATHKTHPGAKAAVVGQGELKKKMWDPLFCINHQLAMCRAHISRLFRRSWNTTKRVDRLADHMALFVDHYNRNCQPRSGRAYCQKHDQPLPV